MELNEVTARSGLPSLLRSLILRFRLLVKFISKGCLSKVKLPSAAEELKNTLISVLPVSNIPEAISGFPSPLRSPTARPQGKRLLENWIRSPISIAPPASEVLFGIITNSPEVVLPSEAIISKKPSPSKSPTSMAMISSVPVETNTISSLKFNPSEVLLFSK